MESVNKKKKNKEKKKKEKRKKEEKKRKKNLLNIPHVPNILIRYSERDIVSLQSEPNLIFQILDLIYKRFLTYLQIIHPQPQSSAQPSAQHVNENSCSNYAGKKIKKQEKHKFSWSLGTGITIGDLVKDDLMR